MLSMDEYSGIEPESWHTDPLRLLERLRDYFAGYELPPGAVVEADLLSARFGALPQQIEAALARLAAEGLLQAAATGGFIVSTEAARVRRNLVARIGPVLVGMARIAASEATVEEIAALETARDGMDTAIDALDAAARGQAYRHFITALAAATHNSFYISAARQLLHEGGPLIDALMLIDLKIYTSNSEGGELRRLVEAVATGSPRKAAAAAQDHALIITHRLDGL